MNHFIVNAFAILMVLSNLVQSMPIVVTRYHTADPTIVTRTHTTGTTTISMPVVEIFISNGVTYTNTLTSTTVATDDAVPTEGTQTVVFNDGGDTTTLAAGEPVPTTAAPTTTAPTTTAPTTTAPTTTAEAPAETPAETTTAAAETTTPATTAPTTAAPTTTSTSSSSSSDSTSTTSTITLTTTVTLGDNHKTTVRRTSTSTRRRTSTSTRVHTATPTPTNAVLSKAPNSIVYSPYNNDGTCKTIDAVRSDLNLIKSKNINSVRVYGTDCNSINTVEPIAVELGMKINQGFWIDSDGVNSIDGGVDALIAWAQENTWDVFDFITIGNEAVQAGYASVGELIDKISSVKSRLRAAGYNGRVTTSEPPVIFEQHPDLCTSSDIDFVGINSHSYFDVNSSADEAGSFVQGQIRIVQRICGDLDVVVTETGYPSSGNDNGRNHPSEDNQRIAIEALLDVVGSDITILSTYNDYWKAPGDYGIEQSFGVIQLF